MAFASLDVTVSCAHAFDAELRNTRPSGGSGLVFHGFAFHGIDPFSVNNVIYFPLLVLAAGVYQMGEDQARSWIVVGTSVDNGRPFLAES